VEKTPTHRGNSTAGSRVAGCRTEEMRDIWVREIEDGNFLYSIGPFDVE